jgi:hypothetical protein
VCSDCRLLHPFLGLGGSVGRGCSALVRPGHCRDALLLHVAAAVWVWSRGTKVPCCKEEGAIFVVVAFGVLTVLVVGLLVGT